MEWLGSTEIKQACAPGQGGESYLSMHARVLSDLDLLSSYYGLGSQVTACGLSSTAWGWGRPQGRLSRG